MRQKTMAEEKDIPTLERDLKVLKAPLLKMTLFF